MKGLIVIFSIVAVWDGFTTVFGTTVILDGGPQQLGAALVLAAVIMAFLIGTVWIWQENGMIGILGKVLWVIALGYDLYTSFEGNRAFLVTSESIEEKKLAILVGLTLLVSSSPIIISGLLSSRNKRILAREVRGNRDNVSSEGSERSDRGLKRRDGGVF